MRLFPVILIFCVSSLLFVSFIIVTVVRGEETTARTECINMMYLHGTVTSMGTSFTIFTIRTTSLSGRIAADVWLFGTLGIA